MKLFVPITKVDVERREVYGAIAEEKVDKSGEIFDYDSSKDYFKQWSADISKTTNGKSLGNVRSMHSKLAAGKLVALNFDDATKIIDAGAKIVDDNEWNKVIEGVYTGFSIGGEYVKRWHDNAAKATRYTANPHEVSIVDNPCMYGATFDIIKADGSTEMAKFVGGSEIEKAIAQGDLIKLLSFEEIRSSLSAAISNRVNTPFNCQYFWIIATFPTYCIIEGDFDRDGDNDKYRVDYAMNENDEIAIGNIEEVTVEYIPIETQKSAPNDADSSLDKNEKQEGQNVDKDLNKTDEVEKIDDDQKVDEVAKVDDKTDEISVDDMLKQAIDLVEAATNLEKAGNRNSKADREIIQKLHDSANNLGAKCFKDFLGDEDKCEHCAGAQKSVDSDEKSDNIEKMVDSDNADALGKMVDSMSKLVERLDGLEKDNVSLKSTNEELMKRIETIEKLPEDGGPFLKAVDKSLAGGNVVVDSSADEIAVLNRVLESTTDGMQKQAISQRIAALSMKSTHQNPINLKG